MTDSGRSRSGASRGVRRTTSPHRYVGPGEEQFAGWCEALGLSYRHEPYLYELMRTFECDSRGGIQQRVHRGFTPDFLITVAPGFPEVNVELTTAAHNGRRRKVSKIRHTQAAFKTHTILIIVDSALWRQLERNPQKLKRLLLRASVRANTMMAA
jgi:hypothetical protein